MDLQKQASKDIGQLVKIVFEIHNKKYTGKNLVKSSNK